MAEFLSSFWPRERRIWWQLGAGLAFWLQVRLFTDLRGHYGPFWSPVWFYLASVLLCGCALMAQLNRPAPLAAPLEGRRLLGSWAAAILGGVAVLYAQAPVIQGNPIDVRASDIIPILQNYVERFRSGEVVYRYLTNLPYPLFPNHLPLQWLPYVLADKLGLDYRWWALGILLMVGFGAYLAFLNTQRLRLVVFAGAAILPWLVLRRMVTADYWLFAHTVEPTIIAYYCLLAASIFSRSALVQAGALVLCLLSRYSVVFWVPLFLWLLWRERGRWHAGAVAGLTALGIVLLYVVPFLSKDWTIFTHALSEYKIATLGEWGRTDSPEGRPPQLFGGLGFAAYFYTYLGGDLSARIGWLQRVHVLASVGAVLLSAGAYWQLRHRLDYRVLALVSLGFYLSTFYVFIQIPYAYLTSLTLFISVFVLAVAWRTDAASAAERTAVRAPVE
ncbi:hypothetical protein [Hymenobacter metallilatus]|uniref:DUF2029 domain-containing protein n=1 Tax=Hymenobacter metallilatus TaxID=2493666 RepID=A0A3R9M3S7_9BACT|nr:hypothetical protein [Hymenobacter metallilatus]RSK31162.1 hypothetical protein EI290_14165 [Hymenobacter metallilatus]